MRTAPLLLPLAAAAALLLTGCGGGSSAAGPATAGAPTVSATSVVAQDTALDVCSLVPKDELKAVTGDDPGTGKPAAGKVDGGQCTWTVSDTHSVLVQYTRQPDVYLPASVWPKPKGAKTIPGTDRGWASASSRTILLVEGSRGLMLNDIGFGGDGPTQAAMTALAKAIAANL